MGALDNGSEHSTRNHRALWWASIMAVAGISIFAFYAWRSVTVERAARDVALGRFADVRSSLNGEPIMRLGIGGTLTRRPPPPTTGERKHLSMLRVLAYRAPEQRLVRAAVPFWFLKVKGPAVQYMVRDTGLDLNRLGLTPADLEQYGASVVLDETRSNGDRLLVWTE